MAIAITESGMDGSPDPYAMNIAGRSHHAKSTGEMAQIIASNYKRGVTSIDVGCMQVNLKYHGGKFARPTDLLDSATNVDYGASYLIKLAADKGSWREGVMDYHNKNNPSRRRWYGCKVWNNYLRISRASSGFVACGKTPGGSSVASNMSSVNKTPLIIAGYNDAVTQPQLRQASFTQPAASTNVPPSRITVPIGNPLDPAISAPPMPAAQYPASTGPRIAYDLEQPFERVMGTIELAGAGDDLAQITTSADPRASAFEAIQPTDWSGRIRSDQNSEEAPRTSRSTNGFTRISNDG